MPPTTLVAPTRKRRFPSFTVASAMTTCPPSLPAGRVAVGAGTKPAPHGKPVDYKGFAVPAESPASAPTAESGSKSTGWTRPAPRPGSRRGAAERPTPPKTARLRSAASVYNRRFTVQRGFVVLRRIWLVFAQACTLCLAALFVVDDAAAGSARAAPATSPGQRRAAAGNVDAGQHADGRERSPMPRRRRCPRSSTSTRARRCGSAARSPTIRCCAATSPTSRSGCRGSARRASAPA